MRYKHPQYLVCESVAGEEARAFKVKENKSVCNNLVWGIPDETTEMHQLVQHGHPCVLNASSCIHCM